MKKIFVVFLILILIFSVLGCSSGSKKDPEYTYKWGTTANSVSAFNFIVMGAEEDPPQPVYSGSIVPPFAAVSYGINETVMGIAVYTYLNGIPVRSNYAVDSTNGIMSVTGPNNEIDIFMPKKTGVLPIIARYNEYSLTISVHVYWAYTINGLTYVDLDTMTVYPDGTNPAVDILFGGANFKAPYGYQALHYDTVLSTVTAAPDGNYRILDFNQEYWAAYYDNVSKSIIKTSEGKYVKLCFLSQGSLGTTFCFWISDTNGIFSH